MNLGETGRIILQTLTRLLKGFRECPADCHYLTYRLHLEAQRIICAFELVEIPARHLYDHVIQRGLEVGACRLDDWVLQLVEIESDGQLRRNLGDGITCRLRCE